MKMQTLLKIKKLLLLVLLVSVPTVKGATQCWLSQLAKDLEASSASSEFNKFIKTYENSFDAYKDLVSARGLSTQLRTDAEALQNISALKKNARSIKILGGETGYNNFIKTASKDELYLLNQDKIIESLEILKEKNLLNKVPDLSEAEASSIHRYTRSSLDMNGKLHAGKALSEYEQKWLATIKKALANLRNKNKFEGFVYRGQSLPEQIILDKYVTPFNRAKATGAPALVEEKAILSTSRSEDIADEFVNNSANWKNNNVPTARPAKFIIESKYGVDIDDISDYGKNLCAQNHPGRAIQEEVLLENGTFRITDVKITDKGDYKEYLIFLQEF